MQCPDPYFKRKHHKRRVVQKPLVDSIVNNLIPSAQVCQLKFMKNNEASNNFLFLRKAATISSITYVRLEGYYYLGAF